MQGLSLLIVLPSLTLANLVCQFVEDEGNILFYKNAHGLAASRPKNTDTAVSDSGVEIDSPIEKHSL